MDVPYFIQRIVESPRDDAPRLIYADWLEEIGQAERARFIRLQVEAASCAEDDPEESDRLDAIADELLHQYHAGWLGPLDDSLMHDQPYRAFQRGLLETASIDAAVLVEQWNFFFQLGPVSSLEIKRAGKLIHTIAQRPELARVRYLILNDCDLEDGEVAALVASPHVQNLWALALARNPFGNAGAAAIAASENLPELEVLRLDRTNILNEGLEALAKSPHLQRLSTVNLRHVDVDRRRRGPRQLAARFPRVVFS